MILIAGPFPPPVHGASLMTERVAQGLTARSIGFAVGNTSPNAAAGGIRYHLNRMRGYLGCCAQIARRARDGRPNALYLSLSGGLGLLYDLLLVACARLKRWDVIFHHHSFGYVNRPSRILSLIVRVAGREQRHVALCSAMAMGLQRVYGSSLQVQVVSNLVFMEMATPKEASGRPLRTLGFISNISFEKGIDRFLDLLDALKAAGSQVRGLVAGPFVDSRVQAYFERRASECGNVTYVGPVYGPEKDKFFSAIDLLVFPTRYENEAEPLVLFEAQGAGIMVAASWRGCIEPSPAMNGFSLELDAVASNIDGLVKPIVFWENHPDEFRAVSRLAFENFQQTVTKSKSASEHFYRLFSEYR